MKIARSVDFRGFSSKFRLLKNIVHMAIPYATNTKCWQINMQYLSHSWSTTGRNHFTIRACNASRPFTGVSAPSAIKSQKSLSGGLQQIRENQTCTNLWLPFRVAFPPFFPKGNLLFSGAGKRPVSMGSPTISTESPV